MSALINHIEITNYRSCIETKVKLSSYTALIGYNNSGKSNILSAIQWLLRKSVLSTSDFCNLAAEVTVIGTIEGITADLIEQLLPPAQQAQIRPFIANDTLIIKRTQPAPNCKAAEVKLFVFDQLANEWKANPTGIDNAIGAIFPEPIRIGAMENAAEDASKAKTSTTIGKLLAEFIAPLKRAHEAELNAHLAEVSKRLSADGDQRLPELNSIDNSINGKIADLFPDLRLRLDFLTPTFEELIRAGTVKVYENNEEGRNFSSYGHGAQRSIQMALIRHLAEVKRGDSTHNTTLLLIDEPELYLHPFAIEHIRAALKSLSNSGYQTVFSTHSAQMISSQDAQHTVLIRKSTNTGTKCRRRLLDAIQTVVPNATHQLEHLFSLTHSSQMLFAENVILTEGKTEHRVLPRIFHIETNQTLGQSKIALIPQDGVDNTKKSRDILQAMDIPSKAIVDLDYAFRGAISQGYIGDNDTDIIAAKALFPSISQRHGFAIDPTTGLPKKNAHFSAAEAYEFIAADSAAKQHIKNIHTKLRRQGIWVWCDGAIEKPLGLHSKTESEWANFLHNCESTGLLHSCQDYNSIKDLITWMSAC